MLVAGQLPGIRRLRGKLYDDLVARHRGARPPAHPRSAPARPGHSACARRSTRCGPTWRATAAMSNCSASKTILPVCVCRAVARPARRRPPTPELAVMPRSRKPARTSPGLPRTPSAEPPGNPRQAGGSRSRRCTTVRGRTFTSRGRYLPLFVCRVQGRHYAYRDRCPACNVPLHLGALVMADHGLEGHRRSKLDAGRSR